MAERDAETSLDRGGAAPDPAARLARWSSRLVASSSDLIAVVDAAGTVLFANPTAERMLGLDPDEQVGTSMFDRIHPDDLAATTAAFLDRVRGFEGPRVTQLRFATAEGDWRYLEVSASNCLDDPDIAGIVVNARDVTEQANLVRALRTLSQTNSTLVHATDETTLLADTCRHIVDSSGYLLAWIGRAEDDPERSVTVVAAAGRTDYLDDIRTTWADDEHGQGPTGLAIRTRTTQVLDDMRRSDSFAPWQAAAERFGFRTSCSLPLVVGGSTFGALMIYAGEPGAFDHGAVGLMRELADNLAYGIGRLRDADRLNRSLDETIQAIAATAEVRDPYTGGHQCRVAGLAAAIAERMGIPPDEVRGIDIAAAVHDLGKVAVPTEILTRPGRLSRLEFDLIKVHPQVGCDILSGIDFPWPVAEMVRQHHERLDGSGYPRGLVGDEILLGAQIIAVADVVEAMSSHRPYRPARGVAAALQEIAEHAGTRYDLRVVDCCLGLFREGFEFAEDHHDDPWAHRPFDVER